MTLRNKPNQPINVHDYPLWTQGAPRCVYVDPCQYQLPEGTKTIVVRASPEGAFYSLHTFEEYESGDGGHAFVRDESWPANVFLSIREIRWESSGDYRNAGGILVIRAQIPNLHATAQSIFGDDFEWPEGLSCPHVATVAMDPRITVQDALFSAPEPLEKLLETECEGTIAAPTHIWVPNNRHKTIEFTYNSDATGVPVRTNFDDVWTHHVEDDADPDRKIRLYYFRRNRWPAGLFRLAQSYRYDNEGKVIVSVQEEQPRGNTTIRVREWPRLTYPTGRGLRERLNLNNHIQRGGAPPDGMPWITHDPGSAAGGTAGDRILHVTYRRSGSQYIIRSQITSVPGDNGYTNLSTSTGTAEGEIIRSYYRFNAWPQYIWSSEWNDDDTTLFGPDVFGERMSPESDETTFDAAASDAFAYQKWFIFNSSHIESVYQGDTLWVVQQNGGVAVERPNHTGAGHHTTMWNAEQQPRRATYTRRGWWPHGIYRRLDDYQLQSSDYYDVQFRKLGSSDEPGLRPLEEGVRWGSTAIHQWVSELEEEIGRTIFERPEDGMPWLSFHTDSFLPGRQYLAVFNDIPLPMMPGARNASLDTDGQLHQGEIYDQHQSYTIATQYRTGLAFHVRPDCVYYNSPPPEGQGLPHPLHHYLESARSYFEEFEDPDLVRDLAIELHGRTHVRTRAWQRSMHDKQAQVQSLNQRMMTCIGQINEYRRKMAYYEGMDVDRFKEILERNRLLVETQGALTYGNNHLTLKMSPFNIEGQPIGPLTLKMTTDDQFGIKVTGYRPSGNLSQYGHPHPHVDPNGVICWGSGSQIAANLSAGIDPLEFLFATAQFLQNGYAEGDAYCKIRDWRPYRVWHCTHCDANHPEGEQCPDTCRHCLTIVDPDDHDYCAEHQHCFSYEDDGGCHACEDALEEAHEQNAEATASAS